MAAWWICFWRSSGPGGRNDKRKKERIVQAMLAEDRRNYILRLLESRSSVSVAELSATFSLSEVSVRKLLSTMEEEGLIRRTWGGAGSAYVSLREFSHKDKEPVYLLEKIAIAKAA